HGGGFGRDTPRRGGDRAPNGGVLYTLGGVEGPDPVRRGVALGEAQRAGGAGEQVLGLDRRVASVADGVVPRAQRGGLGAARRAHSAGDALRQQDTAPTPSVPGATTANSLGPMR